MDIQSMLVDMKQINPAQYTIEYTVRGGQRVRYRTNLEITISLFNAITWESIITEPAKGEVDTRPVLELTADDPGMIDRGVSDPFSTQTIMFTNPSIRQVIDDNAIIGWGLEMGLLDEE